MNAQEKILRSLRKASQDLALLNEKQKTALLYAIADELLAQKDKILNAPECKEFRKECIDAWTKILQPKDTANKFIPYFIKNYDKLGMKISDKHIKKYFDTLKTLADNFDEVKKQFA